MLLTKRALLAMQRPQPSGRYAEMTEGRRTEIILLDDRRLDILVQPKLLVGELLNIVASHCHLKDPDKQYFGLTFNDERQQCHWLQSERRVLEHEFPSKIISGATLILRHQVKFFVESITQLAHAASVELLFLQTRMQLHKGLIKVDYGTLFQVAAFAMQACFGDFKNINTARVNLKRLAVLPLTHQNEGYTTSECEDSVCEAYESLSGLSKGTALLNYMSCLERLNTYGVHNYEVKDKSGTRLVLGISTRGIYQYEAGNMDKPRRGFHWKQLENLYYRDRKFSIEVHDPKRVVNGLSSVYEDIQEPVEELDDLAEALCDPSTQVSLSRRAFIPSNVYVHVFWCETPQLCKTIWSLAISQHQFYLDRRASAKKGTQFMFHTPRELAEKLDQGFVVIANAPLLFHPSARNGTDGPAVSSDLGSSVSSQSVHSIPSTCSAERSEDDRQRELELYRRLKQRKRDLEEALLQKLKELKDVCVKEGEITGELPAEIRSALVPGEAEPKIKRRVGTAFAITSETMSKHTKADQIAKLEADVDIHRKIVAAALKLATDTNSNKSIRRKRRRDYESARQRLRELEQRVHQLRLSASKPDLANSRLDGIVSAAETEPGNFRICKSLPNTPRGSVPDLTEYSAGVSDWRDADDCRSATLQHARMHQGERCSRSIQYSTSFPVGAVARSNTVAGAGQRDAVTSGARGEPETARFDIPKGYRSHSINQSNHSRAAVQANLHSGSVPIFTNRTESIHSLHSNSSASTTDHDPSSVVVSYRKNSSGCDVGAYNIPNQRTSWDQDCMKQTSSDCVAVAAGSSESLNVGLRPHCEKLRLFPSSASANSTPPCYTGSLDRRVLRQIQKDKWRPVAVKGTDVEERRALRSSCVAMQPISPTIIEHLERSPTRYRPPPQYHPRTQIHSTDFPATTISPRLVHKLLEQRTPDDGWRNVDTAKHHFPNRQHVQRSLSQSSTSPHHSSRMSSIQEQRMDDADEFIWPANEPNPKKTATIV